MLRHSVHGHHPHNHWIVYPITMHERLYALFLGPLLVCLLIFIVVKLIPSTAQGEAVTFSTILLGIFESLIRIAIAYALAVVVALPLALLVELNKTVEAILLPVFDVFESIPNLAVLPVLVIFFAYFGFPDGAAIVILFLNMLWSIVFALVGGLKVIPKDVTYAARVFGLKGASYIRRFIIPSIFPQFVTGSILAVASGWNIVIVAEALHVDASSSVPANDLFGIGSILVSTSAQGQTEGYVAAFAVMVIVIAIFNFFVWQKLLNYSQRFRFD